MPILNIDQHAAGADFCFVNLFVILLDKLPAANRFVFTVVTVFSSNGFFCDVFLSLVIPDENWACQ